MDALKVPLKGALKAVWLVIAYRAGQTDECWPSLDTIAEEAGVSRNTVCTQMVELERLGLVNRDSPAGGTSTRYHINCHAALQLTVTSRDTKERQKDKHTDDRITVEARRQLKGAQATTRRARTKEAFYELIGVSPADAKITVPMIARHMGSRQPQVRTDMNYLVKNRDIPFDLLARFGTTKPNPRNFGKNQAAAVLQFRRSTL
jgi:DNA-binding transcriptional regulator YhcF (GntR family)